MTLAVVPSGKVLGAEVRGVDAASPLSAEVRAEILDAWHEHLVLLFRNQKITDPALLAFARNFGELELASPNEYSDRFGGDLVSFPEIAVISNIVKDGMPTGSLGDGEAAWHSDSSFLDRPPSGSFLYSIEIPPLGGNTSFCNMYAAYDSLPPDLKSRIADIRIIHNFAYTSGGKLRKGYEEVSDVMSAPGARHPLIRTHPDTGRKALYLGRRRGSYVVGLPVEESEQLLDALWTHGTKEEFVWTHRWQVGDLLIWDNRCSLHRRDAFDPATRRLMHRTQIKGDIPS